MVECNPWKLNQWNIVCNKNLVSTKKDDPCDSYLTHIVPGELTRLLMHSVMILHSVAEYANSKDQAWFPKIQNDHHWCNAGPQKTQMEKPIQLHKSI